MAAKRYKFRNIRNLLESPFNLEWKEEFVEDVIPVQNALRELLPAAKVKENFINLQMREKKKVRKKDICSEDKSRNMYRTYLVLGFQSVIRGLEKKNICCVILFSYATSLMKKVIFAYTQANGVPIIVIPDLKRITENTLGFTTTVLGFKSIVAGSSGNRFHPLYKMISQNQSILKSVFLQKPKQHPVSSVQPVEEYINQSSTKIELKTGCQYLYRKRIGERIFDPRNIKNNHAKSSESAAEENNCNFLSLEMTVNHPATSNQRITSSLFKTNDDVEDYDDSDDGDQSIINTFSNNKQSLLKERLHHGQNRAKTKSKSLKQPNSTAAKYLSLHLAKSQTINIKNNKSNVHKIRAAHKSKKNKSTIPSHKSLLNLTQNGETTSKSIFVLKNKDKQHILNNTNNLDAISFKPLKIKTVTSNPKKNRKKKK